MLSLWKVVPEEPQAHGTILLHEAGVSKGQKGCLETEKDEGRSGISIEPENKQQSLV